MLEPGFPSLGVQFGLPELNETLCTGCGDCQEVCPTACLTMNGPVPCLPRPLDCISCALCVLICPAGALRMSES